MRTISLSGLRSRCVRPGRREGVVEAAESIQGRCHAKTRVGSTRISAGERNVASIWRRGPQKNSWRAIPVAWSSLSRIVRPGCYVRDAHEWTAVRVPGSPSRQPRNHRTVPQGKSRHLRVQEVGARGRRRRNGRNDDYSIERDGCRTASTDHRAMRAHSLRRITWSAAAQMAVVPVRRPSRDLGRMRCIARTRPLRHLLQGRGRRDVTLGVARLRQLSCCQRHTRIALGCLSSAAWSP